MRRRLTDVATALSLAAERGHGQLPEHQLRVAVLATRLASELRLGSDERRDCFDSALLRWLGCTAVAHPLSAWWGDEIAAHRRAARFDGPWDPLREVLMRAGAGRPLPARLAAVAGALKAGPALLFGSTCEAATHLAQRLGYGPGVVTALGLIFERFDGKGWPGSLRGEAIPPAAQIAMITDDLATLAGYVGLPDARAEIGRRAGTRYDPALVRALDRIVEPALAEFVGTDGWAVVASCDPAPEREVTPDRVTETLLAVADFVDIKIPGMAGHSRAVADLAAGTAVQLGRAAGAQDGLRHAGLLHDLGRVTVPNSVWEEPGSLSSPDREQVRLVPYQLDRFCARSTWLAPVAALGSLHQERLDGSGYHRGLVGPALGEPARILAAADCYRAMREHRAHRPALEPTRAAAALRAEAAAGRLDATVVEAVLAAAGQRAKVRKSRPAGLTEREVEVLALVAQGLPNKQIASRLTVSPRTVGSHIAHIYEKVGVTTRAGATLFALRHDLVETSAR